MVAGFVSEWVAGFKLECMAGFVGIRTIRSTRLQLCGPSSLPAG
jgi:hypothetical protein